MPTGSRNTVYHYGRVWNYESCAAMSQDTHFLSVDFIQEHETGSSEEQLQRVYLFRGYTLPYYLTKAYDLASSASDLTHNINLLTHP